MLVSDASRADPSADDELIDVNAQPPVATYLREIWDRREYLARVPLDDLRAQNFNTVLGNVWHLLNPTLQIGVYYLVFGVLLGTDRGIDNFLTFLAAGVFTYQFTQKSATRGASAITGNEGLIRSIRFPRAILPLTTAITELFAYLPALLVLYVVALATGEPIRATWVLVPLLIVPVQLLFNLGLAFFTARAADLFRDVQNLLPFVFRIVFYLSGILYSVEARVETPRLRTLFTLNPIYAFASLVRSAVLGLPLNVAHIWSALGWTTALLLLGFLWFRAGEHTYGRG